MFTGIENTICNGCEHKDVCMYKGELANAQEAVNNVTVSRDAIDDRGIRLIKLCDIPWIEHVTVRCIHWKGVRYDCK